MIDIVFRMNIEVVVEHLSVSTLVKIFHIIFVAYALSNNISPEHLALAIYYIFLFILTNGERDLCIGMNTDGRYRDELQSVIGMFVNAIPLRCQFDSHWSVHQLIEYVCEMETK